MNTKKITRFFIVSLTAVLAFGMSHASFGNKGGAPASGGVGNTGSPGDGQTCSRVGCHTGVVADAPDLISSNVPASGYIPGQNYTVTVAHSDIGTDRWGFQASPQNISGDLLGSLSISDLSGTKLVGSGKYVTHTNNSIDQVDNTSWTFEWTSPSPGTGEVTFYTCINVANGNGTASGDSFVKGLLTFQEADPSSVNDLTSLGIRTELLQNPIQDELSFVLITDNSHEIIYSVYNLEGKSILTEMASLNAGFNSFNHNVASWNTGVYMLEINVEGKRDVKKLLVF